MSSIASRKRPFLSIPSLFVAALAGLAPVLAQERLVLEPIVSDARSHAAEWYFTTDIPSQGWRDIGFDDSQWGAGKGGFGTADAPGAIVGITWNSVEIYMRHTFTLSSIPYESLLLSIHHDDEAEVYLNGQQVLVESGALANYSEVYLPDEAMALLRKGENVLSVHCANSGGGPQYIDVGLSGARPVRVSALAPDARDNAGQWRFTTQAPGEGWAEVAFDDQAWSAGTGGFGSETMYGDFVGTSWLDSDIWIRRTFTAETEFPEYILSLYHDDEIEILVNGLVVEQRERRNTQYQEVVLSAAKAGVRKGTNTLAVHCRNSGGGPQFVDVGIAGMEGTATVSLKRRPAAIRRSAPARGLALKVPGGSRWISTAADPGVGLRKAFGADGSRR